VLDAPLAEIYRRVHLAIEEGDTYAGRLLFRDEDRDVTRLDAPQDWTKQDEGVSAFGSPPGVRRDGDSLSAHRESTSRS
jgi:hypothetical protein